LINLKKYRKQKQQNKKEMISSFKLLAIQATLLALVALIAGNVAALEDENISASSFENNIEAQKYLKYVEAKLAEKSAAARAHYKSEIEDLLNLMLAKVGNNHIVIDGSHDEDDEQNEADLGILQRLHQKEETHNNNNNKDNDEQEDEEKDNSSDKPVFKHHMAKKNRQREQQQQRTHIFIGKKNLVGSAVRFATAPKRGRGDYRHIYIGK
jgi:hypothetical protein